MSTIPPPVRAANFPAAGGAKNHRLSTPSRLNRHVHETNRDMPCNTLHTMSTNPSTVAIAIHGGAGAIAKDLISNEREQDCHHALQHALRAGHDVLTRGGSSFDAVIAAVVCLEDSPLFNAGRGSVLTYDGQVRTDACVMEGNTQRAGAVTNVVGIRNPVLLARAVLDSPHVFLSGEGAVEFARSAGLAFEEPSYFITEERRAEWQEAMTNIVPKTTPAGLGTVGAVALDQAGNVAAATSTGGMLLKRWGRIGDSPVVGAGTYADNRAGAVSATGYGEMFLRTVAAHEVCNRLRYLGESVQTATETVLREVAKLGGDGGMIAIDPRGNITLSFNSQGMYRGSIDVSGRLETKIW